MFNNLTMLCEVTYHPYLKILFILSMCQTWEERPCEGRETLCIFFACNLIILVKLATGKETLTCVILIRQSDQCVSSMFCF